MNYYELAAVVAVLALFSFLSHRKNSLSPSGIALANAFGLLIYFLGNIYAFATIVAFFIVAEASTKYGRSRLKQMHEKRTTSNVLGNGLAALLAVFFGQYVAFYGAVSAALSDTVSSEIGMLSKSKPRLITRPKVVVERGTDGGVTLLGFSSGILAAFLIGALYYFATNDFFGVAAITAAGIFGSIVDSILGAELERKGIIGNATVNFIASCSGAMFAYLLLA